MAIEMTDALRAAGFSTVEGAERALRQLRRRRDDAADQRLDAGNLGGSSGDGLGIDEQDRRRINASIDQATELGDIEARIAKLEWMLDEARSA